MRTTNRALLCFIAGGMAGAATGVANAQPFLINGSGATLLQALFRAPASTNDFIDVDANGVTTATDPFNSQLAPFQGIPPFTNYWQVTYRVVGSVNGFAELRDWGFTYATLPDGSPGLGTLNASFSDESLWNRTAFVTAGVANATADLGNPAGNPVLSTTDGTFTVTLDPPGANAGMQIDFAAIDVPVSWSIRQPGAPEAATVPGSAGYGSNPRVPTDKLGNPVAETNQLENLIGLNGAINVNVTSPDQFTVFDTSVTLAPVAAMVNYGVGLQEMDMSDLRHLMATGRRINGENLMAATRDSGSGTRNAFANGIGLDPSFCVGENIGVRSVSSANDLLGPNFQPTNRGSSSRIEVNVRNHRLAIGHTGAERGESSGWLINGQADVLAIRADIKGGTVFARPTLDNVLDGSADGYNVVGPAVIATVGDPRSDSASVGGWGWDPSEVGPYPRPVQPPSNPQASAYLNNITRSVAAFVELPGGADTFFSPGEFLASQFLLTASASNVNNPNPDPGLDIIDIIPNPDLNQDLQDFIRFDSGNVLGLPEFQTFNTTTAGRVPTRTTLGGTYSDQALVPGGNSYIDQGGTLRAYGSTLALRNKIAGDFDADGERRVSDAADMLLAFYSRNGGAFWNAPDGIYGAGAGNEAIIEVLGDFDGNGSFDAADIRYWADGLVLTDVVREDALDRTAGFTAVDIESIDGNFFGTSLARGTYDAGDSRADVSGPSATREFNAGTRGFAPTAFDGIVDLFDVDFVCANFGDWSDIEQAIGIDLSADMNGDLIVSSEDVRIIIEDILETSIGDLDLDGDVDSDDRDIVIANQTTAGLYSDGDLNCDGVIDGADLAIINAALCPADFSGNGTVGGEDFGILLGAWGTPDGDLTGDGLTNGADVGILLGAWGSCP